MVVADEVIARPAAAIKVAAYCTGPRKGGKRGELCNRLLFKGTIEAFEGVMEWKCPECKTITRFE